MDVNLIILLIYWVLAGVSYIFLNLTIKWEYLGNIFQILLHNFNLPLHRSEDMEMYQVTMPKDDAWYIMNQLGKLGIV